jgi:hypothetical protein
MAMSTEKTNAFEELSRLIKTFDSGRCAFPTQFYPDQTEAANKATAQFSEGLRYVLLSAQMQSGKTGCALYAAFVMLARGCVDQVFIISGSHETVLRKQWLDDIPWHLYSFCVEHGINDEEQIMAMGEKIINGVFFRQDLEDNVGIFTEKYLILWDESHYAIQEQQQLHQFFDAVGINDAIQGNTSTLEAKKSYVLSITATRGAEQAKKIGANDDEKVECWGHVVMNSGKGYRGVADIKNKNLIFPSVPINEENKNSLFDIIAKYRHQKKYLIIRSSSEKDSIIDQLQATNPDVFDVVRFNMETKHAKKNGVKPVELRILEKQPMRLTLFLVRQMLRMGKQLPKKHICAVYEHAINQNFDTAVQSLLGRICGYDVENDIHAYIEAGEDNRALNDYIDVVASGFTKPIGKTLNINVGKKAPMSIDTPLLFANAPHRIRTDADEYTMGKECNTSVRLFHNKMLGTFCDELLKTTIHLDERYSKEQQTEIYELLTDIAANGAISELVPIHNTHESNGTKHKTIAGESRLNKLSTAIVNLVPVESTMLIKTKMVIYRVNGKNFGGEQEATKTLKMGDCVVIFYTNAKSQFPQKRVRTTYATNGRDCFTTSSTATLKTSERDGDGKSTCVMPHDAKTTPTVFKNFIKQQIEDYLDPSRDFKSKPYLNTKHVLFDRQVYINAAYMNAILKSIEKEFGKKINIKASYSRGKGPLCCQVIKWKTN